MGLGGSMEGVNCELCSEDIDYCECLRCEICEELFLINDLDPDPDVVNLCKKCSEESTPI